MSVEVERVTGPAIHTGMWQLGRGEEAADRLPGILLVPEGDADEPVRFHAFVHDGDRIYSAELRPDGGAWKGEEARRAPHRFQLELEAFVSDGALVAFGTLHCEALDPDGEAHYIGASFNLRPEPRGGHVQ